jgi:hypothetical protein
MLNPIQAQAELSAAYLRMASFALSNQMRIMQLLTKAMLDAPFAQVHALHEAAAKPHPPRKPITREASVGDAGQVDKPAPKPAAPKLVSKPIPAAKPAKVSSAPKAKTAASKAKTAGPKATTAAPKAKAKASAPKAKAASASAKAEQKPEPTAKAAPAENTKAARTPRAPSEPPKMPEGPAKP